MCQWVDPLGGKQAKARWGTKSHGDYLRMDHSTENRKMIPPSGLDTCSCTLSVEKVEEAGSQVTNKDKWIIC